MSAALALVLPPAQAGDSSDWLTKGTICDRVGINSRTVERYVTRGTIIWRERHDRARNGRTNREYLVASLPADLRAKLNSRRQPTPAMFLAAPETGIGSLFPTPVAAESSSRLTLSAEAERLAQSRLLLIQPLLDYADRANRPKYVALRLGDGRAVTTANLLCEYIAETQTIDGKPVGVRTLWDWVKRFRSGGLAHMARKPRRDKGASSFFTRYPAAAALVAAEYHKPFATVARAFDALHRDQQLLQIPDADLPSYGTVRRYLESLPAPAKIMAREGQRAYNERCAPHVARAYTDMVANQTWVADHMIHDVEVRNDCFDAAPLDAPIRLRLTAIMDMRSRKFVGYCWALEGDSRSIATALRRAVERYGPCEVFYCDNGRDFKKAARGAEPLRPAKRTVEAAADELSRRGSVQRLGMKVQYCLPYLPQSKPIERAFRTVHTRLDAILPTYLTGSTGTRPDMAILAGTQHRNLLKAGRGGGESQLIPASHFIKLAETWIEQVYNSQHKHTGRGMNGRTPDEVFEAGYPADRRRTADPAALDTLLYERRSCVVRRTAVTVDKRRYMPAPNSPESWVAVHERNERQIVVAFDPLDPQRAIALDEAGYKIADLQVETLTAHSPDAPAANGLHLAAMQQLKGRLRKSNGIAISQLHRTVAEAGHKTDLQHLAELAQVTVPVDKLVSQRLVKQATRPSSKAHAPASSFDIASEIYKDLTA